jgi:enoyl-CoA hydratase/carnithine racemase
LIQPVCFTVSRDRATFLLRLHSEAGTNLLTRQCVSALGEEVNRLASKRSPLVITGNLKFFSAGADLAEVAALTAPRAYDFATLGQALMQSVEEFPAPVFAAISGYCMGGGLDLALACRYRIASPQAVFGHRGASLGLVTGWGGTQRLPRLIGKGRALEMFVAATAISAPEALRMRLIDAVADDPVNEALRRCHDDSTPAS